MIWKQCHCAIKQSTEPGSFMFAGCPWVFVTSRSFCRALLFNPWPILKLEDSHCEGLSGIFYNLDQSTSSSAVREVFSEWPVPDLRPIGRRAPTVLPLSTFTHSSQKGCCCFLLNTESYVIENQKKSMHNFKRCLYFSEGSFLLC